MSENRFHIFSIAKQKALMRRFVYFVDLMGGSSNYSDE